MVWKLLLLVYAGFYAIIAYGTYVDNVKIGYAAPFILYSACSQSVIAVGIVLYALQRETSVARIWRWLFPLLVLELCMGITMDATMPEDFSLPTHGLAWAANLLFNLWLVAPAYYFNFKIAHYGS
jgi:hypothetical protein